jgi:predicted alpha-1,2-mannosidase
MLLGGALVALAPLPPLHAQSTSQKPLTSYVDPRIGVVGAGNCVIGPALPFASVHPSPDTPDGDNDGYHPDRPIRGFSQTHVSGTGFGQYGNILISPQVGLAVGKNEHDSPKAEERATAYDYRVRLTKYDVLTEFTPAARSVFYQFTFPKTDEATIAIDVAHSIPTDIATFINGKVKDGAITLSADRRSASGFGAYEGGFGGGIYKVYFFAEMNRAAEAIGTWQNGKISQDSQGARLIKEGDHTGGFLRYHTTAGEVVQLKIGISFKSIDQARQNLRSELPNWDFAKARENARQTWERALGSLRIDEPDEAKKTIFYTALYHAQIMPRDRTGEYARFAPKAPMWDDHYAVWDTWRTLYPLLVLIRPDAVRDTVQSFIERQRVEGLVPDTFIASQRSFGEQGGNDVDNIIADAYVKKVPGIDWKAAYQVMKINADQRRTGDTFDNPVGGASTYRTNGWIPEGKMSASFTLEYAYNDFCAAQVAAGLGLTQEAQTYLARSQKWQALWNAEHENHGFKGFVMPRKASGEWPSYDVTSFGGSWAGDFYEGSSWTYSFFVPHQPKRLVELMGGPETFARRLDYGMKNRLIDFGNEPAFLAPQMFHYAGRPDLSAQWIRSVTGNLFSLRGYPGDDDSGAMSSYFIWAQLGLFPNAGQDIYYLNGPTVNRVVVQRPADGLLEITRSGKGNYVSSATLNGRPLTRSWVRHAELKGRAKLAFVMSETPTTWGQAALPPSL